MSFVATTTVTVTGLPLLLLLIVFSVALIMATQKKDWIIAGACVVLLAITIVGVGTTGLGWTKTYEEKLPIEEGAEWTSSAL